MKQEQKPFEIRDAEQVAEEIWYVRKYYIKAANAEIRRLREELREAERNFAKHHYEALSEAIAERDDLLQQLADAPTWGKWTPITNKEQIVKLPLGVYMFDYGHDNEGNELKIQVSAVKNRNDDGLNWHVVHMDGSYGDRSNCSINAEFESYKLIHAFEKPAREVGGEVKYKMGEGYYTATEIATTQHGTVACELAHALLAVQAELRELKGE